MQHHVSKKNVVYHITTSLYQSTALYTRDTTVHQQTTPTPPQQTNNTAQSNMLYTNSILAISKQPLHTSKYQGTQTTLQSSKLYTNNLPIQKHQGTQTTPQQQTIHKQQAFFPSTNNPLHSRQYSTPQTTPYIRRQHIIHCSWVTAPGREQHLPSNILLSTQNTFHRWNNNTATHCKPLDLPASIPLMINKMAARVRGKQIPTRAGQPHAPKRVIWPLVFSSQSLSARFSQ